ncbi:hypothetical protein BMR10_09800, partial [Methylococcaceae bacterium CS4]
NGSISKSPKPKLTCVLVTSEGSPDDYGKIRLKIDVSNAGNSPRIYYQEEDIVTENSPILSDEALITNALRVQFLAVDPTGKNKTGTPTKWKNQLTLRNDFNETARTVELLVSPKGNIRYTLDGSEPRNGMKYDGPIEIGDDATTVDVFAECDGIEDKRTFKFSAAGSDEVLIIKEKPAQLYCPSFKNLDNANKTYEGLKMAKTQNMTFEKVILIMGTDPKVIHLSLGDMTVDAEFIEKSLQHLQTLLPADAPVVMKFKKVLTETGHDLEQFVAAMGIEISSDEVIQ